MTESETRAACLEMWCAFRGWHHVMKYAVKFWADWGVTHYCFRPDPDTPFVQLAGFGPGPYPGRVVERRRP